MLTLTLSLAFRLTLTLTLTLMLAFALTLVRRLRIGVNANADADTDVDVDASTDAEADIDTCVIWNYNHSLQILCSLTRLVIYKAQSGIFRNYFVIVIATSRRSLSNLLTDTPFPGHLPIWWLYAAGKHSIARLRNCWKCATNYNNDVYIHRGRFERQALCNPRGTDVETYLRQKTTTF